LPFDWSKLPVVQELARSERIQGKIKELQSAQVGFL
jgi:hypothetical protein